MIKLDNNKEYICFYNLEESGIHYLYLVTEIKPVEVKFAKYDSNINDDSLIIIGERKEKEYVLGLFQKNLLK